jgi:hypothetical protein
MLTPKEINKTRLHLFGEDPISQLEFHPNIPMTDGGWMDEADSFYKRMECPRTIGSIPKEDIEKIERQSPSPSSSLLSLEFILSKSNYSDFEWVNPKNPKLGKNKISPTYNMALQIIDCLSKYNKIWAGALPDTRSSETWKTYKPLPKEDSPDNLPKDLKPKLLEPSQITLLLKGEERTIDSIPDFKSELLIYEEVGVEIFGRKYYLDDCPFICPLIGEDESYGLVTWQGPLLLANRKFINLLETDSKSAQEIYKKSRETLFFYRSQGEDQDEYSLNQFEEDYPESIALLTNRGLAVKNKIKSIEEKISQSIAELLKSCMPSLSKKILEDCEKTKGLTVKDFRWNPKSGLSLSCLLKIGNEEKSIEIKNLKTKVFSK